MDAFVCSAHWLKLLETVVLQGTRKKWRFNSPKDGMHAAIMITTHDAAMDVARRPTGLIGTAVKTATVQKARRIASIAIVDNKSVGDVGGSQPARGPNLRRAHPNDKVGDRAGAGRDRGLHGMIGKKGLNLMHQRHPRRRHESWTIGRQIVQLVRLMNAGTK